MDPSFKLCNSMGLDECVVKPRKLQHGFRMVLAGIPYTLPDGREENDVPTFWLVL